MKEETFNYFKDLSIEQRYRLSLSLRNQFFLLHQPKKTFYKFFNSFDEYIQWRNIHGRQVS